MKEEKIPNSNQKSTQVRGKRHWIIPGGHIPLESNGREPEFLSQDRLAVLNTGDEPAEISLTIYYPDAAPVGPCKLTVKARRVRKIRINDLIEPYPVPLDQQYGIVIESDRPVIIQFTRMDTSADNLALMGSMGF